MITLLLFGLSYVAGTPIPWPVYLATSLLDGLALPPLLSFAIVPFSGRAIREKVGRLHALLAQVTAGRGGIFLTSEGYVYVQIRDDTIYFPDGSTRELAATETKWYRLGWKPFLISWDKTDEPGDTSDVRRLLRENRRSPRGSL